jgi:hypothetical protein
MHPTPAFRHDNRALSDLLIGEISSGMILAAIPVDRMWPERRCRPPGADARASFTSTSGTQKWLRVAAALAAWEAKGASQITHVMRQSGEAA